jgi:hypothetical protein
MVIICLLCLDGSKAKPIIEIIESAEKLFKRRQAAGNLLTHPPGSLHALSYQPTTESRSGLCGVFPLYPQPTG